MTKIKKIGINVNMFQFINDFIDHRIFQIKVGAELSNVKNLENGTPQGLIISPILFVIMINDMDPAYKLVTAAVSSALMLKRKQDPGN